MSYVGKTTSGSDASVITENEILRQLPQKDLNELQGALEPVELESGRQIYDADGPIDYLYFPNHSVISVMATTENGQSSSVGMIGCEGVVGFDALLGAERSTHVVMALYGDGAYRIPVHAIKDQFNQCGALHDALLRFAQRFMVQLSQKTLCNRLHPLDQRLAFWLLMCDDRTPSATMMITQELLSSMLGSTRASVTLAAIEMQNRGFITYSRGKIEILNRSGIESVSCDCYETIRQAYESRD